MCISLSLYCWCRYLRSYLHRVYVIIYVAVYHHTVFTSIYITVNWNFLPTLNLCLSITISHQVWFVCAHVFKRVLPPPHPLHLQDLYCLSHKTCIPYLFIVTPSTDLPTHNWSNTSRNLQFVHDPELKRSLPPVLFKTDSRDLIQLDHHD